MSNRHTFWIYIFIISLLILLIGISTLSSEARPSPCSKGWAGFYTDNPTMRGGYAGSCPPLSAYMVLTNFFASRNVEPKRQITQTVQVPSVKRAERTKVGKQQSRLDIIKKAADRNGCYGDDFLILLAIRKAENGGPGKEFGVKGKAWDTDLDTQAGEAAATVVKNRARWNEAGRPPDFISFLGDRYVPKEDDPEGNINFKKNVRFWFRRFKNE